MSEFERENLENEFEVSGSQYTENAQDADNVQNVIPGISRPRVNYTETVHKKNNAKRYIAAAVAVAVVNFAVLGGMFGVGYSIGKKNTSIGNKESLVENINNGNSESSSSKAANTANNGEELSTVEIAKKVGPSVVGIISTIQTGISIFGGTSTSQGSGSGIIMSSDGYIVTNNHVIENATEVKVKLNTGTEYTAQVIGADSATDLAVIKINPTETLSVAELGESSELEVGEKAVAIGNPLGMEFFGSTTEGVISAVNRTITVDNRTMNVIQTDAAINSGNSGGALINSRGQVIGINAVKLAASGVEGMGFAIPISEAKPVISDLIEHGYVTGRVVIGIASRDVTEYMAARQGWPMGVQVMEVYEGSGAEIAGLEPGDIIVKMGGTEVKTNDDITKKKEEYSPNDVVELEVYKYETGLKVKVNLKLMEEKPQK